jgi:hypothetical protein
MVHADARTAGDMVREVLRNHPLAAADEAIWDIALPLFESEDTKLTIPAAVPALAEGKPRPQFR